VINRLTLCAAIATVAASMSLLPLLAGSTWFWGGAGATIVVAATGVATRQRVLRNLPPVLCLLAALVALVLYLNVVYCSGQSLLGVLPSGASLSELWHLAGQGMSQAQRDGAPVPTLTGITVLAAGGIGLVAALTDLIAVRLRRSALAGLPLLVLFSVPIASGAGRDSVDATIAFCAGVGGYLLLLAADGRERLRLWGRLVTPWHVGTEEGEASDGPSTRALSASGRRIGLAAVVLALFVPLILPSVRIHRLFTGGDVSALGAGTGPANGQTPDPLVQLSADLRQPAASEILTYHTTDPNAPPYLQAFVLADLTTSDWVLSPSGSPQTLNGGGNLPGAQGLSGHWPSVSTTVRIQPHATLTDGYLPLPYPSRRLTITGLWLADPGTLMVYAPGAVPAALNYTSAGYDVNPSSSQLASVPAAPADMSGYLTVPKAFRPLATLARNIVGTVTTPYAKAVALQNWFRSGLFTYSLSATEPNTATALSDFLLHTRRGYCQQFAFGMAVLARLLGIPSRVAVGFTAGSSLGNGNYVVRTSDAHAWPELYFQGYGWLSWEPTPSGQAVGQDTANAPPYSLPPNHPGPGGTGITPPSSHAPRPNYQHDVGILGRRLRQAPAGALGHLANLAPRAKPSSSSPPIPLFVLVALVVAALVTPIASRSLVRRRRWLTAGDDASRAHAAWRELLDDLSDHGIRHGPGETPRGLAARVARQQRLADPARQALRRLAQAEERASYARTPGPSDTLAADVATVHKAVSDAATRTDRWHARLMPPSAVDRALHTLGHVLDVFGWTEVALAHLRARLPQARTADHA
jgi:transglutaminase-like putative cysteine protease